jgi:hypothetical protein
MKWSLSVNTILNQLQTMAIDTNAGDMIDALAEALCAMASANPEAIRPHALKQTSEAFVEMANAAHSTDDPSELFADFRELDPIVFGQILMENLGHPDEVNPEDKHRAIDVAEHIGSDWAQKLYRFAVLVTKLT